MLANGVWGDTSTQWTPKKFLEAYPTKMKTDESIFDVDIEHFCTGVDTTLSIFRILIRFLKTKKVTSRSER